MILLTVAVAIFASHTIAQPHYIEVSEESEEWCPPENNNTDNNNPNRTDHDSALCANFQHIRAMINQEALLNLIEVHYNCDLKFRRAMRYYNTAGFERTTQQLTDTDAYKTVLKELQSESVDTADIETVADIFHCIILPVRQPDRNCDCKAVKHHTFVGDLLSIMPKQEVHNYVAQSQANHTNFGNFTKAVVSKQFQATLKANIVSRPTRVEYTRVLQCINSFASHSHFPNYPAEQARRGEATAHPAQERLGHPRAATRHADHLPVVSGVLAAGVEYSMCLHCMYVSPIKQQVKGNCSAEANSRLTPVLFVGCGMLCGSGWCNYHPPCPAGHQQVFSTALSPSAGSTCNWHPWVVTAAEVSRKEGFVLEIIDPRHFTWFFSFQTIPPAAISISITRKT